MQTLTDHGCFNAYLKRFKKRDEEAYDYCGFSVPDAEHTLFACDELSLARGAVCRPVGADSTLNTMVPLILKSEEYWQHVESFDTHVMRNKNLNGHSRGQRCR